jgi:hypothetical protein
MFGRYGTVHSPMTRVHALAGILLAIGLAMLAILSSGTAQACPPGKENGSVSITHKAKRIVVVTSVASTPSLAKDFSLGGGQCCGGGLHSHGAGGCCSGCSAAIDVVSSGIALPDGSILHHLSSQDGGLPTVPPPDFRPPRTFA